MEDLNLESLGKCSYDKQHNVIARTKSWRTSAGGACSHIPLGFDYGGDPSFIPNLSITYCMI